MWVSHDQGAGTGKSMIGPAGTHCCLEGKADFPGGPVVKTPCFHYKGAWVRVLVRELKSSMPHNGAKR